MGFLCRQMSEYNVFVEDRKSISYRMGMEGPRQRVLKTKTQGAESDMEETRGEGWMGKVQESPSTKIPA